MQPRRQRLEEFLPDHGSDREHEHARIAVRWRERGRFLERMTMGDLVASFSLIWYIVSPVQQLGYQINSFTQSVAAGERLVEILQCSRTIKQFSPCHVHRTHRGSRAV
jgi:ABC-type multidrug transport system fused ATPase/permease subunit